MPTLLTRWFHESVKKPQFTIEAAKSKKSGEKGERYRDINQ
jgi:hypothetical protein